MPQVMVDASAWIALYHRRDEHHPEALALFPALAEQHDLWTTPPFVFEAHKRLRQDRTAPASAARDFLLDLAAGRLAAVVPSASMPALDAVVAAWLDGPPAISLEDASGALAMRRLGMRTIWAWDDDFRRLGLRVVP